MPEENCKALGEPSSSSSADMSRPGLTLGAASQCITSATSGEPGAINSSDRSQAAHRMSQREEHDISCIRGINQVVLVLQPDESTQYVLLSEERALREAAAKQAALEAAEQGLVPIDPRDAAIMQAIEDGDAAVQRVFQQRLQASLQRTSQYLQDLQPSEEIRDRSQDDLDHRIGEDRWLAQLEAADMALTAQLNSRDAALSACI